MTTVTLITNPDTLAMPDAVTRHLRGGPGGDGGYGDEEDEDEDLVDISACENLLESYFAQARPGAVHLLLEAACPLHACVLQRC